MNAEFTLNIEPFSINAKYSRDLRYQTKRYKDWEMHCFMQLRRPEIQQQLKHLRETFDPKKHNYELEICAYYKSFFNKQGEISAQTEDITNHEKLTVDLLFLPKYHVLPAPYGAPNLNVDDKYLVRMISAKKPAEAGQSDCMNIKLTIIPR